MSGEARQTDRAIRLIAAVICEMEQRFVDAGAMILHRDVTAGGVHDLFHFRNCIRRTSWVSSETPVQHRNVIMMIARSKNLIARNGQEPR